MFTRHLFRATGRRGAWAGLCTANSGSTAASTPQLIVNIRETKPGSKRSRALRKAGSIPGVVYGKDNDGNVLKMMVTVSERDLIKELRTQGKSFENTLYNIVVQPTGEQFVTTPRQIQFSPLSDLPVSVNFLRYIPGNRIRIPIEYINTEENVELRRGSFLVKVNSFVECICGTELPKTLQVDVASAGKGDVFRISHITFPPNVRPAESVPLDYVLCILKSSRRN